MQLGIKSAYFMFILVPFPGRESKDAKEEDHAQGQPEPDTTIFVKNLDFNTVEDVLKQVSLVLKVSVPYYALLCQIHKFNSFRIDLTKMNM